MRAPRVFWTARRARRLAAPVLVLLAPLLFAGCERVPDPAAEAPPRPVPAPAADGLPDEAAFVGQVDRTRGVKDIFTPLRDPEFVAADAAPFMADDEIVLALDLGGEAVCYPTRYLNFHEIVEHRFAGRNLLACWCPLCRTGAVHVREIGGKPVRFGHSGWLWFNAYLLYDEETQSLWHHQWGVALSGPRRGTRLESLPARTMTWAAWRAERPGTLVLAKPAPTPEKQTGEDVYAARNRTIRTGFALTAGGAARFYPFETFPASRVVEEEVGGVPAAIVLDREAGTAFAYDRRVGRTVLSFDAAPGSAATPPRPVLRERGGPRSWWLRTGDPVEGTGAEERLRSLPGTVWEDAAWRLQHRRGTVWTSDAPSAR